MKKIYIAITYLLLTCFGLQAEEQDNVVRLTLKDAITLAQHQSVDAAVALNELKTSYWEYRTHVADQLPEVNFKGTLPSYSNIHVTNNRTEPMLLCRTITCRWTERSLSTRISL